MLTQEVIVISRHLTYTLLMMLLACVAMLNVWSSWQFNLNDRQLRVLEQSQAQALEQNKRLQASITALSSPERLLILVEQNPQWQLARLGSQDILIIELKE